MNGVVVTDLAELRTSKLLYTDLAVEEDHLDVEGARLACPLARGS